MNWIALVLIAFLCGSLPFSVWLGKLFLGLDVRRFGDGNPGATNVFRSGSKIVGLLTLILDFTKAAAPVGLAYHNLGIRGVPMFLISIAPVLGHVFSPFLGFRGGKAVAVSLGVWIGLTIWKASLVGVVAASIGTIFTTTAGWAVMLGLVGILMALLIWMPDPLFLVVWVGVALILIWTHRADLSHPPHWRSWLTKLYSRLKD